MLRAFNLSLVNRDDVSSKSDASFHLGFVRRMSRRLVVFLGAYRAEYKARKGLAALHANTNVGQKKIKTGWPSDICIYKMCNAHWRAEEKFLY